MASLSDDSGRPSGTIQVNLGRVKPWGYLSWPNRISMLRLLLIAPFVVLLLNQQRWPAARYAAIGLFVTMAGRMNGKARARRVPYSIQRAV